MEGKNKFIIFAITLCNGRAHAGKNSVYNVFYIFIRFPSSINCLINGSTNTIVRA